jgi:hypothetical protein
VGGWVGGYAFVCAARASRKRLSVRVWVWGVGAHLKRRVGLGDSYLIRYTVVCIAFELSRVVCAEGIQEQQHLIKKSTRVGFVGFVSE